MDFSEIFYGLLSPLLSTLVRLITQTLNIIVSSKFEYFSIQPYVVLSESD